MKFKKHTKIEENTQAIDEETLEETEKGRRYRVGSEICRSKNKRFDR
ncbi:MAG: hypothetical protein V8R39_00050 [Clostridia bacterium]